MKAKKSKVERTVENNPLTKWHELNSLKAYYRLKVRILKYQLRLYSQALKKLEGKK